jgi:hypothetical protein
MTNTTGPPHGRMTPTPLEGRFAKRPTTLRPITTVLKRTQPYAPFGITMGLTFAGFLPLAWSASSVSGRP